MELRRLNPDDLPSLFKNRNDPDIMKWCRQVDVLHWENHKAWYDWQTKDKCTSMYAIVQKYFDGGLIEVIGVGGLTSIDHHARHAEFSIYINRVDQNRGHGREALKLLFDKGFNVYNLNMIWGESFEGNPAIKLFKKMGMSHDGIRRQHYFKDGKYVNAHIFSLTRDEYEKSGDVWKVEQ